MYYNAFKISLLLLSIGYSQVLWNEPPDTIWYANQSRWVEIILPRPTQLTAKTVNQNQVKLTIEQYWTDSFVSAYFNKFGYAPIPNRYSLYRNGVAIGGIPITDTVYIDNTTTKGVTYNYEYLASDDNYKSIDGLQHWSPRSYPASITVGASQSNLAYPSNFKGSYNAPNRSIDLEWDYVNNATSYTVFKSMYNTTTHSWDYYDYQNIIINNYQDTDIDEYTEYLYSIKSISGNDHSDRSPPRAISTLSFDFGAPSNFRGTYFPNLASIQLSWDKVQSADSYQIFKSFIHPNTGNWRYLTIDVDNINNYLDVKLLPNQTYFYQILSKNGFNKSIRSNTIMVTSGTLNVANNMEIIFQLKQNSPNPFNPYTTISYTIGYDSEVRMIIYDILGNEVKRLINGMQSLGNHYINWDGTNDNGDQVVGGVYFYSIQAGEFNQTKKMVYIK